MCENTPADIERLPRRKRWARQSLPPPDKRRSIADRKISGQLIEPPTAGISCSVLHRAKVHSPARVRPLIRPVVVISFPSHLHLFLLALPRIILCGRLGSFLHLPGCIIGQLCRFFRAPPGLALRGWRQDCRRSAPPMCSLAGLYLPGLCIPVLLALVRGDPAELPPAALLFAQRRLA